MPIPTDNAYGLLPEGLHDATIEEVEARFGRFVESDQRMQLVRKLKDYLEEARSTGFVKEVIVDGSFVTDKAIPNDIDLIVVLKAGHDLEGDLRPFEYNVVSKKRVQKRYGFDVFTALEESGALSCWIDFFSQVRERPGLTKGLVRVTP